jgi:DMSO reductase anchor subunit
MNPAWSVILLTTLIGAGQGLFLALSRCRATRSWACRAGPPAADDARSSVPAACWRCCCRRRALVASFFHLGRPERAWRSAAMWRTSWLSREVIVLPAFMAVVFAWGLAHWFGVATLCCPARLAVLLAWRCSSAPA